MGKQTKQDNYDNKTMYRELCSIIKDMNKKLYPGLLPQRLGKLNKKDALNAEILKYQDLLKLIAKGICQLKKGKISKENIQGILSQKKDLFLKVIETLQINVSGSFDDQDLMKAQSQMRNLYCQIYQKNQNKIWLKYIDKSCYEQLKKDIDQRFDNLLLNWDLPYIQPNTKTIKKSRISRKKSHKKEGKLQNKNQMQKHQSYTNESGQYNQSIQKHNNSSATDLTFGSYESQCQKSKIFQDLNCPAIFDIQNRPICDSTEGTQTNNRTASESVLYILDGCPFLNQNCPICYKTMGYSQKTDQSY